MDLLLQAQLEELFLKFCHWIPGIGNAINATTVAGSLTEVMGWALADDFSNNMRDLTADREVFKLKFPIVYYNSDI